MTEPSPDAPFNEWLRYWLDLRRMTPQVLAEKVNRHPGYIYALLAGTKHGDTGKTVRPSVELAHKIAEVLNLLPEEVLKAARLLKPQDDPQGYLVRRIAQIVELFTEDKQRIVLNFVEALRDQNGGTDSGRADPGAGGEKPAPTIGKTTPPHRGASKSSKASGAHKSSVTPNRRRAAG